MNLSAPFLVFVDLCNKTHAERRVFNAGTWSGFAQTFSLHPRPPFVQNLSMLSRSAIVLGLVSSAAAFSPMSMSLDRRTIVQTSVVAGVAAPLLRPNAAEASLNARAARALSGKAPVITIFDHRGCNRGGENKEYTGGKANGQDDEMLVKVQSVGIEVSEAKAEAFLGEAISLKGKGIDGPYSFGFGFPKPN